MKVTYRRLVPIGSFKALEVTETFYAESFWQPEGTSLIYFKTDRFNVKVIAESDIVSIEHE